jgi:KipI family sensor histidine kinase inhibitor
MTLDGEDLKIVAEIWKIAPSEIGNILQTTTFRVSLIGFAPGFPYLEPLEGSSFMDYPIVPRLSNPRSSVPAGSIGIAAGMVCIYPHNLPGGWNIVGRTDTVLFNVENDASPALLSLGDTVSFADRGKE